MKELQTRLGRIRTAKQADFRPVNRYNSKTLEGRHRFTLELILTGSRIWASVVTNLNDCNARSYIAFPTLAVYKGVNRRQKDNSVSVDFSDVQIVHQFAG